MDEGFVRAVVGIPGSGKSLFLAQIIEEEYENGYRVLITNFPVNKDVLAVDCPDLKLVFLNNKQIAGFWRRDDCPRRSIVVIDECQNVYDAQEWKAAKADLPDIVEYWSQVRANGDRVYVASQAFSDIILFIRRRIELVTLCTRLPLRWFMRVKWHVSQGVIGQRAAFWKFIPFKVLLRHAKRYHTHGIPGETIKARVEAPVVKSKFRGLLVGAAVIAGIGVGGGVLWWFWPRAKPLHSIPILASTRPAPPRGVRVAPPASAVYLRGDEYVSSDPSIVVLSVLDRGIKLGLPNGRTREEFRDKSREYSVIRDQRSSRGTMLTRQAQGGPSIVGGADRPER